MNTPLFPERLTVIEDEIAGIESMVGSRTRKLWSDIVKLQAEVKELRERTEPVAMSAKEF